MSRENKVYPENYQRNKTSSSSSTDSEVLSHHHQHQHRHSHDRGHRHHHHDHRDKTLPDLAQNLPACTQTSCPTSRPASKPELGAELSVQTTTTSLDSKSIVSEFPPPYWEDKLAKNTELFIELNRIPNMKQFLQGNIMIVEQFMKYPDIAMAVARDRTLAMKVMDRPLLVQEMIDVSPLLDPLGKRKGSHDGGFKRNSINPDEYYYHQMIHPTDDDKGRHSRKDNFKSREPELVVNNVKLRKGSAHSMSSLSSTDLGIVDDERGKGATSIEANSSDMTLESRATFPFDAKIAQNTPPAIKYLADSDRIFLTHHIEILDGTTACCDKQKIYYDILDAYGRLLYRAYEGPPRHCNKPSDIVIREPDGTELIVMKANFGIFKKKIDIFCPPGSYIGCVEKKSSLCSTSTFNIKNVEGDTTLIMRTNKRYYTKSYRTEFELRTFGDHNTIGRITGEWLDLPPGCFTSNLVYGVNYPKELNYNIKIGVMTAWFLIYKLYYDGSLRREIRHDLTKSEKDMIRYVENTSMLDEQGGGRKKDDFFF
ncbi:Phospholipid scramblase 2 [Folsomia candida]|uniref:Phospholipid scramblase 2 n=1 Tax=Folsomia candida TaxID=158441 RepID=A0A226F6D6_FOLCA|nr:Phospholipid scramblase 2 [Folsomia candida]